MADTLMFVDFAYSTSGGSAGNVLLDINDGVAYCLDEIEFPPPKPRFEYRDPAHGDGRDVSRSKWENREIKLHMHVFGTTDADLATNAQALWANLLATFPVLCWKAEGWADPLFFDLISPPISIDPPDWFITWQRDYDGLRVISNITITLEAQPFMRAAEESLNILYGLGPNDSFEQGSFPSPTGWVGSHTGAGSDPATSATALDGSVSANLTTGAGASTSVLTDADYLLVDATHHYALQVYCYQVSGAPTLDVDLLCYDDTNTLIGTLYPLVAYAGIATTWIEAMELGGSVVINPSTSGLAMKFPVGTTKVKRVIRNDKGSASSVIVDKLFFGDTEFIAGYKPNGAVGIVIPPEHTLGDVPALADLYFTNPYSSGPWLAQNSGFANGLLAVSALDSTHVWTVGASGAIRFYNGVTWTPQTSGTVRVLYGIHAINTTVAWAVGDNGTIIKTTDGGTTWVAQSSGTTVILWGVQAFDANTVYAVGASGTILKTTDGGAHWVTQTSGTTKTLYGVSVSDATHVLVVGYTGTILKTTDGTNWTAITSGTSELLLAIHAFDATRAWCVGYAGEILFSGDAGVTWTPQVSGTTKVLRSVYAASATVAWAVGDNGTIIKTTDGGTTWVAQADGSSGLYGVEGISTTSVWAVGADGTILHGIVAIAPVPLTNVIIGQRPRYSASYNPVKDAISTGAGKTITSLYTRRNQRYLLMANTGTLYEEFSFNLADHEGRYAVTGAVSWAGTSPAHANAIVIYKLETLAGTNITTDTQTETVLMADPNTKWKEVMLNTPHWTVINLPSFQVGDSASKGNILQIIKIIQDAADDQDEWLDYCAIVPIDGPYVEVANWTANTMILDSSSGLVIASLDGSQDTGQVFSRANIKGFPQFTANPEGINMTMIQLKAVTADYHANDFCNIVMRYSPLYLLVGEA